jgi:hypothetical protein
MPKQAFELHVILVNMVTFKMKRPQESFADKAFSAADEIGFRCLRGSRFQDFPDLVRS